MKTNFTEADGHQIAADMLREIKQHWLTREDGVPDDQVADLWRHDDSTILRRYLASVRRRCDRALERGFFAALTDYLGSESPPDPEFYEAEEARHG